MSLFSLDELENLLDRKIQDLISSIQPHQLTVKTNFLSRKAAAKKLSVSLPTLNDWTKKGIVVGYRIGARVLYKEDELDNALTKIKTET